jgi:uncharacterized LabA/DUF88 family protein
MREVTVIVDQRDIFLVALELGLKVDAVWQSRAIDQMVRVFGAADERIALVLEHDEDGLDAYLSAGYQVTPMGLGRWGDLYRFIRRLSEKLVADPPRHLIVVSSDSMFQYLLNNVLQLQGVKVSVWSPGDAIPAAFSDPIYNPRLLDDLVDKPRRARVDVRIDYENLHGALAELGNTPRTEVIIEMIEAHLSDLGDIVNIVAYADWRALARQSGKDAENRLIRMGVETRNLINIKGKNSADMRVADDIRSIIERKPTDPQAIDIIVLCSSDRDFRPLLRTARKRGQKMILLAMECCIGDLLKSEAKSDIRYFTLLERFPRQKNSYSDGASEEDLWPENLPLSKLVMQIAGWFHNHNHPWATPNQIARGLALDQQGRASLDKLIEDGVCKRRLSRRRVIIRLDPEHKIARLALVLSQWLVEYFERELKDQDNLPINTDTVTRAIRRDPRCQRVGLGKNPNQIEAWLDLAVSAGILVKKLQQHSKSSRRYVNTWWLPGLYYGNQMVQ